MNYVRPGTSMMRMRRSRRGLGDDCSSNPCTWWDDVYLRDACMSYLQSCDPTSPLLTVVQKGLIVGGAQVVGGTAGSAVGTAVNATATNFADSALVDPSTGDTNWGMLALIAAGGLAALMILPALIRGGR